MTLFKKTRFALPFVIFIIIAAFLWRGLSLRPSEVPSPLINKPVPEFTLPTLFDSNEKTTNDDFIGHISLLNVWATWCYACAEEHQVLMQLANKQDMIIYGLNYKDNDNDAKKWLAANGNPYKIVAFDKKGSTAIDLGVYGTPETFVVDKKGVIRYKHIGPITMEVWDNTIEPLINQLRSETL